MVGAVKVMDVRSEERKISYGEKRTFRGLEAFAIRSRLNKARSLIEALLYKDAQKELNILELGCGFWGRNLRMLSNEFPSVHFTGVDLTVTKEDIGEVELIEANITQWEPGQSYDGALSLAVVEHLIDPSQHFALISSCLNKGGLAGVTTPAPQAHFILEKLAILGVFDRAEIDDHQMYFTKKGLFNLAKDAGLIVEEYKRMSFGLNQWMLLRRQ